MKKLSSISLTILLTNFLLMSCGKAPHFIGPENIEIEGLVGSEMLVSLDYMIFNPNKAKATLEDAEMALFFKDSLIGYGRLEHAVELQPKDTLTLPMKCRLDLNQLAVHADVFTSQREVTFRLKGKNGINLALGNFKMKFNEEVTVNTHALLQAELEKRMAGGEAFTLKQVRLTPRLDIRNTQFEAHMEMKNDLPFAYTLNDLALQFYTEDGSVHMAEWALKQPVSVKAGDRLSLDLNIKVDNLGMLRQLRPDRLMSKKAYVLVRGKMRLVIDGYKFLIPIMTKQPWTMKSLASF